MAPHRDRGRYDDDDDDPGTPTWLLPALVGGGAVVVSLVVVVALLSRRAPPPAAAPTVVVPADALPTSGPEAPFRPRLVGVWERPPVADGFPFRLEFRPDGSAEVRHQQPGGDVQVAPGQLVAPERAGPGLVQIQITVPNGMYGFRCRVDGDELVLAGGGGETRFRRAR